jgi:hypothetical protein
MGHLEFSVIIPLEFHRGQALQCVEGWTRGQTFPREHYQVFIAAPEGYPDSDWDSVRAWRRRHAEAMSRRRPPETVIWRPDDAFRGQNLHGREEHAGERLRWTGPGEITPFELYLGPPKAWALTLQLHRATPIVNVRAARLKVNGVSVVLEHATATDGSPLIHSGLDKTIAGLSRDGIASFELETPVVRGEGEFRMLGVALKSVTLRAV